jgi:hypothetical protein
MPYTAAINKMRRQLSEFNNIEAVRKMLADELWKNLAVDNNLLRIKLRSIAETESLLEKHPDELYEVVFASLILLAKQWPLNDPDPEVEGQYISPIGLQSMAKPVYTSTGWNYEDFEIRSLLDKSDVCPLTKQKFLERDLKYMKARMTQAPITPEQRKQRHQEAAAGGLIALYAFLCIFLNLAKTIQLSVTVLSTTAVSVPLLVVVFVVGVAAILGGCALYVMAQSQATTPDDLREIAKGEALSQLLTIEKQDEAPSVRALSSSAQIVSSISRSSALGISLQSAVLAPEVDERVIEDTVAQVAVNVRDPYESGMQLSLGR